MDQHRLLELAGVDFLTEKMDPTQEFAIATVTRRHIADMVNNAIEDKRLSIPRFAHDDPRLTPRFCKGFAEHMQNWHESFRDTWLDGNDVTEQVADFISEVGMQYLRTTPKPAAKKKATSTEKK